MAPYSWISPQSLTFSCLILSFLVSVAHCIPYVDFNLPAESLNTSFDTVSIVDGGNHLYKKDDKPFELRILPLGASLTFGLFSESGNGYRKALRDQLRFDGWEVDMVGTKSHGNMKDNVCFSPSSL